MKFIQNQQQKEQEGKWKQGREGGGRQGEKERKRKKGGNKPWKRTTQYSGNLEYNTWQN